MLWTNGAPAPLGFRLATELTACIGEDFLVEIRKKAAGAAFFWGMGDGIMR
ncbi:MAG: hypothetical protein ACI391_09330 [Muribaculaceae bacterium]